jgi:hypothetical protein
MEIKNGFMEITHTGEEPQQCAAHLCSKLIQTAETCLVDVQEGGEVYCMICGACERYHRKKAAERGEAI